VNLVKLEDKRRSQKVMTKGSGGGKVIRKRDKITINSMSLKKEENNREEV
jgi:hypothetical protein